MGGLKGEAGLDGFEADLAFLFGAGSADPNYATLDRVQFIVAGDDLDELPALEAETAPEAESFGGTVHHKAGNPLGLKAKINDYARSFSHGDTFGASGFACGKCGHCFVLGAGFPHYTHYRMSSITGSHRVNTGVLLAE